MTHFLKSQRAIPNLAPLKVPWILLLILFSSPFLLAQDTITPVNISMASPNQYALKETHREIENTYYLVDTPDELSQLDLATIIEQSFNRVVERYYVSENRLVTRIIYEGFENSFNIGVKPALTVITPEGVKMIDADGNTLANYRTQEEDETDSLELAKLYTFTMPNSDEIPTDATVNDLGEGTIEILQEGDRILMNEDRVFSEVNFYSDEGDIKGKQLRAQEVLPTGEFVLTRAKTIQYVTLPSGACAEFVTETTYSDYNFDDRRVENRSKTIQPKGLAKKVIISPNPIDDMVHIEYSQIFEGSERLDLAIYHVDGELKKQIQVLNIGTVEIPVSDLEAGVYLIKIKNDTGKVITKKFVKL